jgi:hypothetical protein
VSSVSPRKEVLTEERGSGIKVMDSPALRGAAAQARRETEHQCRALGFNEDTAKLTEERGSVYGPPKIDFGRVARMKEVIAECKDPLARHALEMIAVKIARLIQSPDHVDSWRDIAGYAKCGEEVTR